LHHMKNYNFCRPGANLVKLFTVVIYVECLPLASLSSLA